MKRQGQGPDSVTLGIKSPRIWPLFGVLSRHYAIIPALLDAPLPFLRNIGFLPG
jgi:hypothetical protein